MTNGSTPFCRLKLPRTLAAFLAILLLFSDHDLRAEQLPELYFYPGNHQFSDGSHLPSVQTVTAEDITTNFPEVPQMSGVALTVYWSTLCRVADSCDFSLIDRALDYWHARGKKVILAVSTMGNPIRAVVNGRVEIQNGTPDWVMNHSATFKNAMHLLAEPKYGRDVDTTYAAFWDPRFVNDVGTLVRSLANRYDTNATISQIRIGPGLFGEDNAPIALGKAMPGYSEDMWLQFCRRVTDLHLAAFHHRELEFDIGRLSWMYALGSPRDRHAVDEFVNYLLRNKVLLAFDGLKSADVEHLQSSPPSDGIGRSLYYLQTYRRSGGRIGLEAISTELDPSMADVNSIIETIKIVNPNRLVFMNLLASAISYKLYGLTPQNSIVNILGARQHEILDKTDQILAGLGYR